MGTITQKALKDGTKDRRSVRRYPFDVDLAFQLTERGEVVWTGTGRTVNASSGGILFESANSFKVGTDIKLQVAWPARLDDVVALQLWVIGRIVRSYDNRTAVTIHHHVFRTKAQRDSAQSQI